MAKSTSQSQDPSVGKGKQKNLDDYFPFEFIEQNTLIHKNGGISIGYECIGQPRAGQLSADLFLNLHYALIHALQGLPLGTVFQKLEIFYEGAFTSPATGTGFLGRRWLTHFNSRPVMLHKSLIFLCFPNPLLTADHHAGNTWFARGHSILPNPHENMASRLREAEQAASRFLASLTPVSELKLNRLDDAALELICYQYFNLDFSSPHRALNQAVYNDLSSCIIGDKKLQVVSMLGQAPVALTSLPDRNGIEGPMLTPLLMELQFPHILVECIKICDTEKELVRLDTLRSMLQSFSNADDQGGEIHETGIRALSAEIRSKHYELVKLSVQVLVYDSDSRLLGQKTNLVLSSLLSVCASKAFVENIDTTNLFFSCLGGNATENYRWILMPAVNAACFTSFQSFSGRDNSGLVLCNRFRQPVFLNFWNVNLDNKNKLVIGPSGSGKSFTVNSFISQHFHEGDDVIIIDIGGSYKGLFAILEGKYFEYNPACPMAFNPFLVEWQGGQPILTREKLSFLVSLISILWKQTGQELMKTERSFLHQYLTGYYAAISSVTRQGYSQTASLAGQVASMNGFYAFLENQLEIAAAENSGGYFDLRSLLIVLREFTGEGAYGYLLNAPAEIEISDYQLLCFDLNGIREDLTLFPVVSLLLIELVLDKIRRFPLRRKHVYMDEAWSMLKDALGDFVMNMYRTIRKSNGAISIITQGIDEIDRSPVGKAIVQNAAIRVVLDHASAPQQYPLLQNSLGLTEHEMSLIRSLRKSEQEGWREFFIKFGTESEVYMLEAPPEARIAFDSRIEQRDRLSQMNQHYQGNVELAIDQLVENERRKT